MNLLNTPAKTVDFVERVSTVPRFYSDVRNFSLSRIKEDNKKASALWDDALLKVILDRIPLTPEYENLLSGFSLPAFSMAGKGLIDGVTLLKYIREEFVYPNMQGHAVSTFSDKMPYRLHERFFDSLGTLETAISKFSPLFNPSPEDRLRSIFRRPPSDITRSLYSIKRNLEDISIRYQEASTLFDICFEAPQGEPEPPIAHLVSGSTPWLSAGAEDIKITEIRLGRTIYPLRGVLSGQFVKDAGEFRVAGMEIFVGRGVDLKAAKLNWDCLVHERFQKLYGMRPFEMNETEREGWEVLARYIDIGQYMDVNPLILRKIGKLLNAAPGVPRSVEWEDGTVSRIEVALAPGSFAAIAPGEYFEAVVLWDTKEDKVLRLDFAQMVTFPSVEGFWEGLTTTAVH